MSQPSPVEESLPAELGEVIGGYRLDAVIGHGGMGCVYAGTHARLGRRAAVKVLRRAYAADTAYVARFFDEARVVNAIRHPNIIDIFDFVELETPLRVACIMELLEGPTLRARLKQGALTAPQALNLALQLADALRKVHEISVVHRDLKPDNLVVVGAADSDLSQIPSLKVLDFGIAKVQVTGPERTTPGLVLGTPAYMSPEQVSGQKVSAASDVYAWGTVVFEMIVGRRLFLGEPMAIFRQKLMGEIPTIELPRDFPEAERMAALIRGCIAFEKERRPPIEALEEGLRAILNEAPASPRSPPRAPAPKTPIGELPTLAFETPPPQGAARLDTVATFQGELVGPSPSALGKAWIYGAVLAAVAAVAAGTFLGLRLSLPEEQMVESIEIPVSRDRAKASPPLLAPAPEPAPAPAAPREADPELAAEPPPPASSAGEPKALKSKGAKKKSEATKRSEKKVLRQEDLPVEQRPKKGAPLKKDDMVPW